MSSTKSLSESASHKLRVLVKNELTRRFQRNPSYSLRAFSRGVGVDQSLLSKILKGKRDLSFSVALKLGHSIGLSMSDLQRIFAAEGSDESRANYNPLNDDQFMIISEWQHFALLELMQTKGFRADLGWVARRLGISVNDARFAIERLEKCGFIKKISSRNWMCTAPNNSWSSSDHTNLARRTLQQRLLDKAKAAIDTVKFEERENASLTIAVLCWFGRPQSARVKAETGAAESNVTANT